MEVTEVAVTEVTLTLDHIPVLVREEMAMAVMAEAATEVAVVVAVEEIQAILDHDMTATPAIWSQRSPSSPTSVITLSIRVRQSTRNGFRVWQRVYGHMVYMNLWSQITSQTLTVSVQCRIGIASRHSGT